MGLLSWLNRTANEARSPTLVDPGFERAERALQEGAAAGASVVGIEHKLNDGTPTRFVAIALPSASGTRVGGVQVTHGPAHVIARLHLGAEVLVRHDDGDAIVLDWPAMCARWGIGDAPGQKRRRKPPASGVTDTAVDWALQRRLKKWTARRATITALRRHDSVAGATLNFDVTLRLDDGSDVLARKTQIPFYAAWLAAPGAEVPVAIDPKDPANAVVDWAAAANEPGRASGRLDDRPPDGSAAALLAQ